MKSFSFPTLETNNMHVFSGSGKGSGSSTVDSPLDFKGAATYLATTVVKWQAGKIAWYTFDGLYSLAELSSLSTEQLVAAYTYGSPNWVPDPGTSAPHFNLWHINGQAPASRLGQHHIITSFQFTPNDVDLSSLPANLNLQQISYRRALSEGSGSKESSGNPLGTPAISTPGGDILPQWAVQGIYTRQGYFGPSAAWVSVSTGSTSSEPGNTGNTTTLSPSAVTGLAVGGTLIALVAIGVATVIIRRRMEAVQVLGGTTASGTVIVHESRLQQTAPTRVNTSDANPEVTESETIPTSTGKKSKKGATVIPSTTSPLPEGHTTFEES
jgi:hypothetical protein